MQITKEIREKTIFDLNGPLRAKDSKLFVELLAMAVLKHLDNERYGSLKKSESPDLVCDGRRIGVEVTKAVLERDAYVAGNHVKYRLCHDEKQRKKLAKKIEQKGGEVDSFGITYPNKTCQEEKDCIVETMRKKSKKASEYCSHGINWLELFIYCEEPFAIYKKEDFSQLINSSGVKEAYDKVWVYYWGRVFEWTRANDIHFFSIGEEDHRALSMIARLTVDGEIGMDDPIWQ